MKRKYSVSSEAGDGINGKLFDSLNEAKAAVERVYGHTGAEWDEVPGTDFGFGTEAVENSYEYVLPINRHHTISESAARIDNMPAPAAVFEAE